MKAAISKITAETTYSQLKALVPDATGQKMQGRTIIKSDVPKLITVEDSGLTISVYENGFFTAQDDRERVTARPVWNCEAMTFEAVCGKPESVTEEVYGSLPFPMVLSQFGQWNLDHAEEEREAYHGAVSLSEGNVKETEELSTPDFADEVVERLDGKEDEGSVLKRALDSLTEAQLKVVKLTYYKKKDQKQIAALMGISQQMVSKHLVAAQKKIKKFF